LIESLGRNIRLPCVTPPPACRQLRVQPDVRVESHRTNAPWSDLAHCDCRGYPQRISRLLVLTPRISISPRSTLAGGVTYRCTARSAATILISARSPSWQLLHEHMVLLHIPGAATVPTMAMLRDPTLTGEPRIGVGLELRRSSPTLPGLSIGRSGTLPQNAFSGIVCESHCWPWAPSPTLSSMSRPRIESRNEHLPANQAVAGRYARLCSTVARATWACQLRVVARRTNSGAEPRVSTLGCSAMSPSTTAL
jgi:hypothetical protein